LAAAKDAVEKIKDELNCESIFVRDDIAEISVVGIGMRTHYGVADRMFGALAKAEVNIDSITTSEIRISCIVNKNEAEKALKAVSAAFELDKPAEKRKKN
jgi:aspartate kinase